MEQTNLNVLVILALLLFGVGIVSAAELSKGTVDCSQARIPFTPEWHMIHDFQYDYTNEYGVIVYKPRPSTDCDFYDCRGV